MADNATSPGTRPRPLSPHVQIYRWPATMATSIVHRMTGVGLTAGMVLLAWWLMAVAMGPEQYDFFTALSLTPLGQIIVVGFLWALAYHFLNGIRHLAWDIGLGFSPKVSNRISVLIILGSIAVAAGIYFAGYGRFTGVAL